MKFPQPTPFQIKTRLQDDLNSCSDEKCISLAETIALKTKERINCDKEKAQLRDALTDMKMKTKVFLKGTYMGTIVVNRPYNRNQNKQQ